MHVFIHVYVYIHIDTYIPEERLQGEPGHNVVKLITFIALLLTTS